MPSLINITYKLQDKLNIKQNSETLYQWKEREGLVAEEYAWFPRGVLIMSSAHYVDTLVLIMKLIQLV